MGGTLTGGPFSFCVGDGVADNLAAGSISLTGSTGANNQWLVTDSEGNILGLPPMPSAVDFDGAGVGACLVWHLSYEDSLVGLEAGLNANDLQGCFDLSNPVTVNRDAEGGACDAGADACPIPSEATITFQSMTRLTLDWEEVDGAESYIIQARIKGSNQWAVTASLESSSARVRAVPDRDFEYRIKTVCADGESEYSPVYEFNTTGGLVGDTAESRSAEQSDADLILTDVGMTKTVEVAPNPFTDGLQVKYEVATENTLLSIYHINGKKVYEQYLAVDNVVHTIEGTNLENGFYILSIQEEGQQAINLRIIKQNRF